jgi:RHS repeat-associated protein
LDPWGNTRSEYNPRNIQQPIRMQGQQWDEETGLFYNRYRYYQPLTGGYITKDPIGLNGGLNAYQYPLSPMRLVDPLGLQPNSPTADAKKIIETFNKTVSNMVSAGDRLPGSGWLNGMKNNFKSEYHGYGSAPFKDCVEQALCLKSQLKKLKLEGEWEFNFVGRPGHYWLEAIPKNPGEKSMTLDPWLNKVENITGKPKKPEEIKQSMEEGNACSYD